MSVLFSIDQVALSWIEMHLHSTNSREYHDNFWAYEYLEQLTKNDPFECLKVINRIRSLNESDIVIQNLAAGPMEDLLVKNGHMIIGVIIEEAIKDPKMGSLLKNVWKNSIDDEVWSQLQNAIK